MYRRVVFLVLSGLMFFGCFLATAQSAFAQETAPINLTISPITLSLNANPGETVTAQLKIRNNSAATEKLVIRLGSFVADASGEKPKLIEPNPNDTFLQWLTVSEPNFEISGNEWKTIQVTFSPPSEAALAYYYTIYIQRAAPATSLIGAKVEGTAAVLVLTNVVSPQAKRAIQLEDFSVKQNWLEFLPQDLALKIANTGNVHVTPIGNIFIDGQGKKDLAVLSINPNNNAILPNSTRTLTVPWNDGFPVWNAEQQKLDWDFNQMSHLRFGKYTAHAVLVYDNGERDVPIESYVSFWVIPWRLIAAAVAIPVIPALLVFVVMKWIYAAKKPL